MLVDLCFKVNRRRLRRIEEIESGLLTLRIRNEITQGKRAMNRYVPLPLHPFSLSGHQGADTEHFIFG